SGNRYDGIAARHLFFPISETGRAARTAVRRYCRTSVRWLREWRQRREHRASSPRPTAPAVAAFSPKVRECAGGRWRLLRPPTPSRAPSDALRKAGEDVRRDIPAAHPPDTG